MSTLISHQNKLFNHTFCQTYHIYEDKEIHFLLGDKAVFFPTLKFPLESLWLCPTLVEEDEATLVASLRALSPRPCESLRMLGNHLLQGKKSKKLTKEFSREIGKFFLLTLQILSFLRQKQRIRWFLEFEPRMNWMADYAMKPKLNLKLNGWW